MKKETLLSEYNLSVHLLNTLQSAGITTVADLSKAKLRELSKYRGFGKQSIFQVEKFLETISPKDNNGWTKIESEKDLPNECVFCWVVDKQGEIRQVHSMDIELFYYTHYQLIKPPLKPIY